MNYKIKTVNASQKLATMISCVRKGQDQSGRDIDTWILDHRSKQDKGMFVPVEKQWSDKGYILCTLEGAHNDTIKVEFKYWGNCPNDIKSPDDAGILLGRFTELLINHFADLRINIEIIP